MSVDHYTYRVTWSPEDGEYVGLCADYHHCPGWQRSPKQLYQGFERSLQKRSLIWRLMENSCPSRCRKETIAVSSEFVFRRRFTVRW
jgi:hypothetical protein